MNPEQILCVVEEAIKERPRTPAKKYHICMHEGKIKCMNCDHSMTKHPVFVVCNEMDLDKGFNAHEWGNLLHKIANYMIRNAL